MPRRCVAIFGMRFLLCPDKFKGTFTAPQVAKRLRKAILKAHPDAEIDFCPLADGGEGFAEVMAKAWGVKPEKHSVSGPLGHPVEAVLVWKDAKTACLAMSSAAGFNLVTEEERDAWAASTLGVGQLVQKAVMAGATTLYVGLGGSCTNDGGMGLAAGLGVMRRGGKLVLPKWAGKVTVIAACDVTNPLLGPNGAIRVFGPQKGVLKSEFPKFEERLKQWVAQVETQFPKTKGLHRQPGCGAAGGLGYALRALLGAELRSGFGLLAEALDLPTRLASTDVVITGEGQLDSSSFQGKVVGEVAAMAKKHRKPCYLICGRVAPKLPKTSLQKFVAIADSTSVEHSNPKKRLKKAAKSLVATISERIIPDASQTRE